MLSLEEISDRLELQHLLISYSEAIDRREFDELDEIFTPDAYIDYRDTGGIDGQYPQIKAWLAETLPKYFERNAHMLGLPAIKLAGDTATARTFCFNPMVLKGESPRSCRSASGTSTSSSAPQAAGGCPAVSRTSSTTRSCDGPAAERARFPPVVAVLAQWAAVCRGTTAPRWSHT